MANFFWDHVIQISFRVMNSQDIFLNCESKKLGENMHSLKTNFYFRGTAMYVQYGFLYFILTRNKFTVCEFKWVYTVLE